MGVFLAGPNGGGGRGRRVYRPMSEINVTPMVDVMLVLLIIFMVTAPLLTSGVKVDLPKTEPTPLSEDIQPLSVTIDGQGRLWLQDTEVAREELVPRLEAITAANPETRVFVRGDRGINYGLVMEVMGELAAAGFVNLALVTEPVADGDHRASR